MSCINCAGAETEAQIEDVRGELEDRYGPLPLPIRNLLLATSLKMLAQRVGVAQIDRKQNVVHLKFTEKADVDPAKLAQFVASNKGAQFSPGGTLKFVLRSTAAEDVISRIAELLRELAVETVRV